MVLNIVNRTRKMIKNSAKCAEMQDTADVTMRTIQGISEKS